MFSVGRSSQTCMKYHLNFACVSPVSKDEPVICKLFVPSSSKA